MEDLVSIERRASRIKLLLMDCDGVLTDGRIWLLENGEEQKAFNVRDGLGIDLLHRAGLRCGVISGRTSKALAKRAGDLKIDFIRQGSPQKVAVFEEIVSQAEVDLSEVAFIGDDLNDIPLMKRSELAVAVADAAPETRSEAHYITATVGGSGAVREVIELILKSQGRWSAAIESFVE